MRRRRQVIPAPTLNAEEIVAPLQAVTDPVQPTIEIEEEIPFDIPEDEEFKRSDVYVPM